MKNPKHQLKMVGLICVIMAVAFGPLMSVAWAEDQELTAKADSVTIMPDVNGHTYVRIIVIEKRSKNGVNYEKGIPVMFFGDALVAKAKNIKEGQSFKAIVTPREYRGRESYTALALF